MTCPNCGGNTKVIDSRPQEDSVYRRRECLVCKERFSTTEIDMQMYEKMAKDTLSEIQAKVNETMDQIKNNINKIVLNGVLKSENKNNQN